MSIQEMFLNGDGKSEKVISVPMVVDEKVGHPQMETLSDYIYETEYCSELSKQ